MDKDKCFNVLDMVDDYASANDIEADEIFSKTEEPEKVEEPKQDKPKKESKKEPKKAWTPDESLLDDMPEMKSSGGAVYNKDEVKLTEDHTLHNIADDNAEKESKEALDELSRKEANIEEAKKRHKITKLQIPPGEWQVRILTAANDSNTKRAQDALDVIFDEIENNFPEFILEKEGDVTPEPEKPDFHKQDTPIIDLPEDVKKEMPSVQEAERKLSNADTVSVNIDKTNLNQVTWSNEELDKIKKARVIELNIVEGKDIDFGNIVNASDNAVDMVLAAYKRKTNDKVSPLPASKYRATFTGLTYPEVLDLSTSVEMNNLDGERKKWSICFDHIQNQSIGDWEEYYTYTDQENNIIRADNRNDIPDTISEDAIHYVSRYEDFLRKTSYLDVEFMLWKILCATTMDKEIISIECHSINNGKPCNTTYDWIYDPDDLLAVDSMNPAVLADMEEVAKVNSYSDIMELFKSSPVNSHDYVKLPHSGFIVIYGHISAYEYLNSLYSKIQELSEQESVSPNTLSKSLMYMVLTTIKSILIPQPNGSYVKITGVDNLLKVLDLLDEVDWNTISEIASMMTTPYQNKFMLKDCTCPKCHNKSSITIDSMTRLLFIIARSLNSVSVTLKKT
jgi:hypothetical protein